MSAEHTMVEQVILVDEHDQPIGVEEKLEAHRLGKLHRAFSVFLFRSTPGGIELLLQQRQVDKYHCGGLWTNTCCSHPRPEETVLEAARRRLREELNIEAPLTTVGSFVYRSAFNNGLIEHEFDHLLVGRYAEDSIQFNQREVQACRWVNVATLLFEFATHPEHFTPWFHQGLQHIMDNPVHWQELTTQ